MASKFGGSRWQPKDPNVLLAYWRGRRPPVAVVSRNISPMISTCPWPIQTQYSLGFQGLHHEISRSNRVAQPCNPDDINIDFGVTNYCILYYANVYGTHFPSLLMSVSASRSPPRTAPPPAPGPGSAAGTCCSTAATGSPLRPPAAFQSTPA